MRQCMQDMARRHLRRFPPRSERGGRFGRNWLARSGRGVAALEFALLAPLLMAVSAGLYDLTTAFIAWKRVSLTAQAIAEIATIMAATTAGTNQLTLSQVTTAASAIYAYLPATQSASPPAFGVVISSVVMQPTVSGCTTACTYTANVAWSGTFQGSGTTRQCGTLSFVADTAGSSPATLPTDTQGVGPLLVVDVNYTFYPFFYKFFTGPIPMKQSAYFSPRIGLASSWVQYYPGGASDTTTVCPNYPVATSPA